MPTTTLHLQLDNKGITAHVQDPNSSIKASFSWPLPSNLGIEHLVNQLQRKILLIHQQHTFDSIKLSLLGKINIATGTWISTPLSEGQQIPIITLLQSTLHKPIALHEISE